MTETARTYLVHGAVVPAPPIEPALYLVSTPIGNLGDITLRALATLAAADTLAAEDTRVTRVLLDRYGIRQRPVAYHEHNSAVAGARLIEALQAGRSVALVSDAGTPLISDPGYRLVLQALEAGIRVVPVPGASAVLAALAGSGLPTDSFLFAGFLPAKAAARATRLRELAAIPASLVFYESPHRLPASLKTMAEALGPDRQAVVARELTKHFEEFRRETLAALADHYAAAGAPKGEIVICVAPPAGKAELDLDRLLRELSREMPATRAAAEAARLTGLVRSDLYRRLLDLKSDGDG